MEERMLKDIIYQLKETKKRKLGAIVLLGAGASVSAGIPSALDIQEYIKKKFGRKPRVKSLLKAESGININDLYYRYMEVLSANERKQLLSDYITHKNVKLNHAHIYLAQLLKEGYVDYVLTVNFDDLLVKACALYDFIPPIYDITSIKELSTLAPEKRSIIYLHGQHFGYWQMNTVAEMKMVSEPAARLIHSICSERMWIVMGYSGADEMFGVLNSYSKFDNDLFWVGYKDKEPISEVQKMLSKDSAKGCYLVRGYDADSFFLDLHSELKLDMPPIFEKPFTYLSGLLAKLEGIPDSEHEKAKLMRDLVKASKVQVEGAINMYEREMSSEQLSIELIKAILKHDFDSKETQLQKATKLLKAKNTSTEDKKQFREILLVFYLNWGVALSQKAEQNRNEGFYQQAIDKYKEAAYLSPEDGNIYYNWGNALSGIAELTRSEEVYHHAIAKYEQAAPLSPKNGSIYYNWGIALYNLAELTHSEELYRQAIAKYEDAVRFSPENGSIYMNWGTALCRIAEFNGSEDLYQQALAKYKHAAHLSPEDGNIYYNWGNALSGIAELTRSEEVYHQALAKYEQAAPLSPTNGSISYNWGVALYGIAKLTQSEGDYRQALDKYEEAAHLSPENGKIYMNWGNALYGIAELTRSEEVYRQAIAKYEQAACISPEDSDIYHNWGLTLVEIAKLTHSEDTYRQATEIYKKGIALGDKVYNLACLYALRGDKAQALSYLQQSLEQKEVSPDFIRKDTDWDSLRTDPDFIALLARYS